MSLYGTSYLVDSGATGLESAFVGYNKGVDGIRSFGDQPLNLFIAPCFKTQDNNKVHLFLSHDGTTWNRLNRNPLTRADGPGTIGGRDLQLFWCRETGEWLMPTTAGVDLTNKDYSVWRSKDLRTWHLQDCVVGPNGPIKGTTLPGAAVTTTKIWGPRLIYDNNGDMWLMVSCEYGPDYIDFQGNPSICMRPHMARVIDPVTMETEAPQMLPIRTGTDAMIGPDFFYHWQSGRWRCCVKNSAMRNIEIWTMDYGDNFPFGNWALSATLDQDGDPSYNDVDSIEGGTWCIQRYYDPATGDLQEKYLVHISDNRDDEDKLVELPKYFEAPNPWGPYNATPKPLDFSHATRNYSVFNAALEPDPRAAQSIRNAAAAFSGEAREKYDDVHELPPGVTDLRPQQDFLYYIAGNNNVAALRFPEKSAERFWIGVLSFDYGTGIRFATSPHSGSQHFGFGADNYSIIEVRYCDVEGRYIPVMHKGQNMFKATMSSDQNIGPSWTNMNFDNESFNIGGNFGNAEWTPGRGLVRLYAHATLANPASGEQYAIQIMDGDNVVADTRVTAVNNNALALSVYCSDKPISSSRYYVRMLAPSSRNVSSSDHVTYFEGYRV